MKIIIVIIILIFNQSKCQSSVIPPAKQVHHPRNDTVSQVKIEKENENEGEKANNTNKLSHPEPNEQIIVTESLTQNDLADKNLLIKFRGRTNIFSCDSECILLNDVHINKEQALDCNNKFLPVFYYKNHQKYDVYVKEVSEFDGERKFFQAVSKQEKSESCLLTKM